MSRWIRLAAVGAVLAVGLAQAGVPAQAQPAPSTPVLVRGGDHPGFSRIVFNWPAGVAYELVREGDRLRLHFGQTGRFEIINRAFRNVRAVAADGATAQIDVAPGAQVRHFREGTVVVIDVADAPRGAAARPARTTGPAPAAAPPQPALRPPEPGPSRAPGEEGAHPTGAGPAPPLATPARPAAAPASAGLSAPAAMPERDPAPPAAAAARQPAAVPSALTASRLDSVPRLPPPDRSAAAPTLAGNPGTLRVRLTGDRAQAWVVPFSERVGAAALRRGDTVILVFDQPYDLDLGELQGHPVFGQMVAAKGPTATVVQFRIAPPAGLRLSRSGRHWMIEATREQPALVGLVARPIQERPAHLELAAAAPSRVVSIADPTTSNILLIGTQAEPGQGIGLARQYRDFSLLPTLQGIAVLPRTDDLALRVTEDGFAVVAGAANPTGLSLSPGDGQGATAPDTAVLSRAFDIPRLPTEALWTALRAQTEAAAKAPPLARAQPRIEAAETLLALGLAHEAQSLLALAAAEDPRVARAPRLVGLGGVAALLAGRFDAADALSDRRLTGTDEVELWRALLNASREAGAPDAAAALAKRLPLLLSYAPPLRARIAPLAAETMALAGELPGAERVTAALEGDTTLDLARAMILEGRGDDEGARRLYQVVETGRDRLRSTRAAVRLIELRRRRGELTAGAAADALARQLDRWRGDGQELALRVRIADLRRQAGAWRPALAMLRETAELFPEQRVRVRAELAAAFNAMLREGGMDALPAAQFVALVEENTDLLPGGAPDAALAAKLADRLLALDLPGRADSLLARLAAAATDPVARARIGAQLAAARLLDGKAAAALAALAQTAPPADAQIGPGLVEERTLLYARAELARGDRARAVQMLRELDTAGADELRATVLWAASDWSGAAAALADLVRKTLPPAGAELEEGDRQTLLRLATAASLAGDAATLAQLRAERDAQLGTGPLAAAFRFLTNGPLTGLADLPVLAGELEVLRQYGGGSGAPRPAPPSVH